MSSYRRSYGRSGSGSSAARSRWIELRYAATCKVCGTAIPKGTLAYWDAAARTVTCHSIECCDRDGLTRVVPLTGPWDTRGDTRERTDTRVGRPAGRVIVTRFNSGASVYQNSRGRCIDAPCCGCCS
jgi:hypothetical protein